MELIGRKLGRYSIGNLIGSGGMGEVYQGEDLHIRRKVAMKVVRHELAAYPNKESQQEAERLFRREIRAIANLDHPFILPLYDYGEETIQDSIYAYMVMPLRHEGSLAQWLRQQNDNKQRLQPEAIATLTRQAARALQYAHRHNIVHQDVKPSNFLIRTDEETPQLPDIQLADFGIARLTSATASHSQTARGTPNYMAPEQWSGQPVPATDQYALACMAYQLLTDNPPFRGRSEQIMYQHLNVQPQPTRTLYSDIPQEVDQVLLRALSKKPEERFENIMSFANELQQALQVNSLTLVKTPLPIHSAPLRAVTPVLASSREISEQQLLRATLAISNSEAQQGTTRTLTLPGGYKATINVPAGAREGQAILLPKQGEMQNDLQVVIAIKRPEEERPPQIAPRTEQNFPPTYITPPLPPVRQTTRYPTLFLNQLTTLQKVLTAVLILLIIGGIFYSTNFNYSQRQSLLQTNEKNPYADKVGQLVLNDPLHDNTNGYFWYTGGDENGSCQFQQNQLLVHANTSRVWYGCQGNALFNNFSYEVQMRIVNGNYGGILFGGTQISNNTYYMRIGKDGSCTILTYQGTLDNLTPTQITPLNFDESILASSTSAENLLAVSVRNNTILFYINNKNIGEVQDDVTNIQMHIGFAAGGNRQNANVVFQNAKVWQ